ncbi:MAG: GNAT family N-acetyltransferase [Patescibacteria group bacterium]
MTNPLLLTTEQKNVVLRELSTDADDVAYFEAVDTNRDHLSQLDDITADKYPDLESVRNARLSAGSKIRMGIWDGETFVGTVNATPDEEGAEIGYWLDSRYTGKGHATIAVKALSSYVAERFPKVHAEVIDGNDKSVRVLERAGFHQTAKKAGKLIFELGDIEQAEAKNNVTVREVKLEDVENLRPVLEQSICNPITKEVIQDEVEEVLFSVRETAQGLDDRTYVIAETPEGRIVGVMGLQEPDEVMRSFADTDNPVEIINAYVAYDQRGMGTGRSLVKHLDELAKQRGYKEIVLNSGPRYMQSGWPFWRKIYGEPAGVAKNFYNGRYDAMVWRKSLVEK